MTTRKEVIRTFAKPYLFLPSPNSLLWVLEFSVSCFPSFSLPWVPHRWSLGQNLGQGTLPSWSCTGWSLWEVDPSPWGQEQSLQEMTGNAWKQSWLFLEQGKSLVLCWRIEQVRGTGPFPAPGHREKPPPAKASFKLLTQKCQVLPYWCDLLGCNTRHDKEAAHKPT